MKTKRMRKTKGVTLTELLVVLAIIALLSTLAVPVYINQMQRARVATAQSETRQIAEAMQQVAITHGFLVPIHVLDNIPNRDDTLGGNTSSQDDFDNMFGKGGTRYVIDVTRPLDQQLGGNQLVLRDTGGDPRVVRMVETWQGPFLNPKRVRYENEEPEVVGSGDLTSDLVVDPWGNPYRVYSPFGMTGTFGVPTGYVEDVFVTMDDLRLPGGGGDQRDRFDRFAIVSFGPDGDGRLTTGNNPLIQGDDIFYQFTVQPGNESRYQFF